MRCTARSHHATSLIRDLAVPADLPAEVNAAVADFDEVVTISLKNTLLMDRLEATGVLSTELARDHGALGYVARASGLDIDARRDHPFAAYEQLDFRVPVFTTGDVKARTYVRVDEVRESATLIDQACRQLPSGPVRTSLSRTKAFAAAFEIVEGWRGRIAHWVITAADGSLHRVKIVDPSFFNWPALSYALEGNIVPDFPLCNKSFNQSTGNSSFGWVAASCLTESSRACHHQIRCKFDEAPMLDIANDIRSLSDFKRKTSELLERLKKTGNPLVLTINGKAEVVVQDAEAYQELLQRVETIEGVQRGLADVKAGRTRPAREAFNRLRRKRGIPR